MNYLLLVCLIFAMICGFLQGLGDMAKARKDPSFGVSESKNIFTFLFTDEYK